MILRIFSFFILLCSILAQTSSIEIDPISILLIDANNYNTLSTNNVSSIPVVSYSYPLRSISTTLNNLQSVALNSNNLPSSGIHRTVVGSEITSMGYTGEIKFTLGDSRDTGIQFNSYGDRFFIFYKAKYRYNISGAPNNLPQIFSLQMINDHSDFISQNSYGHALLGYTSLRYSFDSWAHSETITLNNLFRQYNKSRLGFSEQIVYPNNLAQTMELDIEFTIDCRFVRESRSPMFSETFRDLGFKFHIIPYSSSQTINYTPSEGCSTIAIQRGTTLNGLNNEVVLTMLPPVNLVYNNTYNNFFSIIAAGVNTLQAPINNNENCFIYLDIFNSYILSPLIFGQNGMVTYKFIPSPPLIGLSIYIQGFNIPFNLSENLGTELLEIK